MALQVHGGGARGRVDEDGTAMESQVLGLFP